MKDYQEKVKENRWVFTGRKCLYYFVKVEKWHYIK